MYILAKHYAHAHIVREWTSFTFVLCAMILSQLIHVLMRDEKEGRKKQACEVICTYSAKYNILHFRLDFLDIRNITVSGSGYRLAVCACTLATANKMGHSKQAALNGSLSR